MPGYLTTRPLKEPEVRNNYIIAVPPYSKNLKKVEDLTVKDLTAWWEYVWFGIPKHSSSSQFLSFMSSHEDHIPSTEEKDKLIDKLMELLLSDLQEPIGRLAIKVD